MTRQAEPPHFALLRQQGRCACGEPLHYTRPDDRWVIEDLFPNDDDTLIIKTDLATYRVQRHYLALHGVAAIDLPALTDQGIVECLYHE